jgi:hypothetical protein
MAITYISTSELIVAESHPFYTDIKNRGGKYIQAQIEVEHSAAGIHDNRTTGLHVEIGSYVGDGTASKVISLTNTNLNPLYVEVWYSHAADEPVFTTPEVYDLYSQGYGMPWITGGLLEGCFPQNGYATGSFTVGFNADNHTNRNGSTFYYLVIGYEIHALSPTGGVDPTWVEHGDSLLGGAVGTEVPNKVEKYLEDAFLVEHADAGTHSSPPLAHRIEQGTYTGNDADDRVISLVITDLDLKYLLIRSVGAARNAAMKTEDLAGDNTKENDAAAFAADMIQDITTNGQFQIGTNPLVNDGAETYFYVAIGD